MNTKPWKVIMKLCLLSVFFFFFLNRVLSNTYSGRQARLADLPPRGWNSYDSFCWTISEEEFIQNAQLVAKRLKPRGYEYVVVDYLWYRRKVKGAYVDSLGFDVIDKWGRMIPDPGRWPSSSGGKGFTEVANKVHNMGLKFGIHVMRGISTQAVNANTPILDITTGRTYEEGGRQWHAKDIGLMERVCAWMPHGFMSVNTNLGAGKAFLRSLYHQYAEWGVDFVKHDCVFGDDLNIDEISFVSGVLRELNHSIVYSLSPGTSVTPAMAKDVSGLVNMYRITGDDWDSWGDVAAHFDVSRDFSAAKMTGTESLMGKSWPDLDMLPLGWLTDQGSNDGPHRFCRLTLDEQRTQMTLWSMAKSPLMFGGDMRKLDEATFKLITNPILLEINAFSLGNKEFPYITGATSDQVQKQDLTWQSNLGDESTSEEPVLSLTICKDSKAKGWSIRALGNDIEQVCWPPKSRHKRDNPLCLYKREPMLALDEELIYKQRYKGKLHLIGSNTTEFCLGASAGRRLTSKDFERGSFSHCRWDANQMWQLNSNGTLANSYSGLCASINSVQVSPKTRGIRAWIACGRRGEIYLAFFNLNSEKTVISTSISDLAKALPGKNLDNAACTCQEIWSGKNLGTIKKSFSMAVEMHGCALFVLNCKYF